MNDEELRAHSEWSLGNLESAFELFFECASQGIDSCMLNLGYCFDEGIGTNRDKQQAMFWYKNPFIVEVLRLL